MNDYSNFEEPLSPLLLREFLSHNLNFKGVIYKIPEEEKFEVSVYEWHEDMDEATGEKEEPVWERVSGPFIADTYPQAEKVAEETLHLIAGEIPDSTASPEMSAWLREYSGDSEAEYLDPHNFSGRMLTSGNAKKETYEPLQILHVLTVFELYVIETVEGKWYVGTLKDFGEIDCWATFWSLKEALDALNSHDS